MFTADMLKEKISGRERGRKSGNSVYILFLSDEHILEKESLSLSIKTFLMELRVCLSYPTQFEAPHADPFLPAVTFLLKANLS